MSCKRFAGWVAAASALALLAACGGAGTAAPGPSTAAPTTGQPSSTTVVDGPPARVALVVAHMPAAAAAEARPLDWGDVRVWLPAAWTPSGAAIHCHSDGFTELTATTGIGLAPCHYPPGRPALTITKLTGTLPAGGRPTSINGIAVLAYPAAGTTPTTVDVLSLHTQLTAYTPAAAGIVATLQHSIAYDLLAASASRSAPAFWKPVVWDGLSVDVPAAWHLERPGYSPCDFGGDRPDVVRGPLDSSSGCAAEAFAAVPTTHGGVAFEAGPPGTVGAARVEHHGALTLTLAAVADTPSMIDIAVTGGAHPAD